MYNIDKRTLGEIIGNDLSRYSIIVDNGMQLYILEGRSGEANAIYKIDDPIEFINEYMDSIGLEGSVAISGIGNLDLSNIHTLKNSVVYKLFSNGYSDEEFKEFLESYQKFKDFIHEKRDAHGYVIAVNNERLNEKEGD